MRRSVVDLLLWRKTDANYRKSFDYAKSINQATLFTTRHTTRHLAHTHCVFQTTSCTFFTISDRRFIRARGLPSLHIREQ